MTSRFRIVLGCVCGALAALFIALYARGLYAHAHAQRAQAIEAYGGEVVEVCVTTHPVRAGEEFTAENVARVPWLVDLLPEGVVQDESQIMGKRARFARPSNMVLLPSDVGDQEVVHVPEGMVACSIPSAEVRAVGGEIHPGDKVDVYITDDGARRLAQELIVLNTSQEVSRTAPSEAGSYTARTAKLTWITLAAPPELVESLISAATSRSLYLTLPSRSLRSQKGSSIPYAPGASQHDRADQEQHDTAAQEQHDDLQVTPVQAPEETEE